MEGVVEVDDVETAAVDDAVVDVAPNRKQNFSFCIQSILQYSEKLTTGA